MRPSDSILKYDFPNGRAVCRAGSQSGVYPAVDTGFRMPQPNVHNRPFENRFADVSAHKCLPEFYHNSCVGDNYMQERRNQLDALRILCINGRRMKDVRDIDEALRNLAHA